MRRARRRRQAPVPFVEGCTALGRASGIQSSETRGSLRPAPSSLFAHDSAPTLCVHPESSAGEIRRSGSTACPGFEVPFKVARLVWDLSEIGVPASARLSDLSGALVWPLRKTRENGRREGERGCLVPHGSMLDQGPRDLTGDLRLRTVARASQDNVEDLILILFSPHIHLLKLLGEDLLGWVRIGRATSEGARALGLQAQTNMISF